MGKNHYREKTNNRVSHENNEIQDKKVDVKVCLWATFKKDVCRKRGKILSLCFTLILTLLGFLFTIGDDFFSQYNLFTLVKHVCSVGDPVSFGDIKSNSDMDIPEYYFILDVSKSTKNKDKKVALDKTIKKQIEEINNSGYCDDHKGYFREYSNKSEIDYNRLLQVRLLFSLQKLNKLYEKKNKKLVYRIVYFSNNVSIPNCESLNEAFTSIYNVPFDGDHTDFSNLFSCLQDKILKTIGPSNNFRRRECHLIFFSDYSDEPNNKLDPQNYRTFLNNLYEKHFDVKLYYQENIGRSKGFPIDSLLLAESPLNKVEILNVDSGIISPIISRKPISFYYRNSLFEENLVTTIRFDSLRGETDLSFGLKYNPTSNDEIKQDYYISKGSKTRAISGNLLNEKIDVNEEIKIIIKGYIPAPYKSPDIIIQDNEEGIRYIVPVAFYVEFPLSGYFILLVIIVLVIIVIYTLRKYSQSINKQDIQRKKE